MPECFLPWYDADDVNAYVLPWWRQLIWSVLFVSMATVSTCGNLIVIWIVMAQKRMRTVTNIFIGEYVTLISLSSWQFAQNTRKGIECGMFHQSIYGC